jgi:hypothetical protein
MEIIGDKGKSQKQATLRMASRLAIRPDIAPAAAAFMTTSPRFGIATEPLSATPATVVNSWHSHNPVDLSRLIVDNRTRLSDYGLVVVQLIDRY